MAVTTPASCSSSTPQQERSTTLWGLMGGSATAYDFCRVAHKRRRHRRVTAGLVDRTNIYLYVYMFRSVWLEAGRYGREERPHRGVLHASVAPVASNYCQFCTNTLRLRRLRHVACVICLRTSGSLTQAPSRFRSAVVPNVGHIHRPGITQPTKVGAPVR